MHLKRPRPLAAPRHPRDLGRRLVGVLVAAALATVSSAQTVRTLSNNTATVPWNTASNWGGNVPNAADEQARIGTSAATGTRTLTFNPGGGGMTVGGILFDQGTANYTITGNTSNRVMNLGQYGINHQVANRELTLSNFRLTLASSTFFRVGSSGNLTIATAGGNLTTTGFTLTLNGTGSGAGLISATINGTGNITKSESGNWTLSGTNSYSGNTTVTGGTLFVGSNGALGTSNIVLNGGTLAASGGARSLNNANISLTATSTIGGANNIVLNGTVTNNAGADITLNVTNTAATTFNGTFNLANTTTNRTVTLNVAGGNTTLAGVVANGGGSTGSSLVKTGAGNLTISSVATYGGGTTVSGGTLKYGIANALPTATAVSVSGATLDLNGFSGTIGNLTGSGTIDNAAASTSTTLTVGNTTSTTFSGVIQDSGAGATLNLTKTGTGELTLSGTSSSYSGKTSIQQGTLTIASIGNVSAGNSSLGAPTSVANGTIDLGSGTDTGTLKFTGASSQITNRVINLAGTTGGGVIESSGAGSLALTSNLTATGAGAKSLTLTGTNSASAFGGVLQDGSGTTSLVKDGSGTWTLNGANSNTYTGGTTVAAGTLALAKSGSATAVGSITINNTGTVRLDAANQIASTAAVTFDSGASPTLNLNGYAQTVASISSTNANAQVQLGSPGSSTHFTVGNSTNTSFAGTFTGGSNANLVKTGTGNLTLTGASSLTGGVNINAGAIVLSGASATLGSSATTSVTGTGSLALIGGVTGAGGSLSLAGTGGSNGALTNVSGTNRYTGNVTLSSSSTIGSQAGTLNLGADRPLWEITGHEQAPENGFITIGGQTLTFTGAGSIVVNSRIQDNANQAAGTSYSSPTTATYSPQTHNYHTGNSSFTSNTPTAGNVTINMTGSGSVTYRANANAYTGTTTVQAGTLILDTTPNVGAPHDGINDTFHAINGALVIGTASGTSATVTLQGGNDALSIGSTVTLYDGGTFNLNSKAQTIDTLTFNGGQVTIGTGSLYLNNDVVVNATPGKEAVISATSSGSLIMSYSRDVIVDAGVPDATRTFTVHHGTGNDADLTINAIVKTGDLVKAGTGTLVLSKNNTYTGFTSVKDGVLNIQMGSDANDQSGLGSGDSGIIRQSTFVNTDFNPTGNVVTANNTLSGTLQLQGGITVETEKLYIAGNGFTPTDSAQGTVGSPLGALNNFSGTNTWGTTGTELIVLSADARINSSSGLLQIPTNIGSLNNNALTIGGAGNTTISGSINTGEGSSTIVNKDGTGTLILSGHNTYDGATNITQGVLSAQHDNALGSVSTGSNGTFVTSGAELQLSNAANGNRNIGGEALTINGAGVGGTSGALRNVGGNNTFGGQITLGTGTSSSTIKVDSSTSLALTGGVTSAAKDRALIVDVGNGATLTQSGSVNIGTVTNVAADTTLPGIKAAGISTGSTGTLTKNGAGLFTFSGGATSSIDGITLNLGGITVSNTGTFVKTGPINSTVTTTLTINSGSNVDATTGQVDGGVQMYVGNGQTSTIAGTLAGSGILKKDGAGTLLFNTADATANHSYNIGTLVLNGGTLQLGAGVHLNATNIYITGDTILDFGGSANTWLTSANLYISAGVTVTVNNWFSVANNPSGSTVWYATNTIGGIGSLGGTDSYSSPLNPNITFTNWGGNNYTGLTTTWVSGNHNGWFDHEIRPTPEPSTYGAIFLGACFGFLGYRRWRAKKQA